MPTVIIDCHDLALRGLRDPYSNEVLEFKMVLGNGKPRLFSPNATSPTLPQETSVAAYRVVHTRGGIDGALGDREIVRCPYTGEVMRPANDESGYYWIGGFDPTIPVLTATEFINKIRMRDGKLDGEPRKDPPFASVVEAGSDVVPVDVKVGELELTKDVEDTVRDIVDGPKPKKTVVGVNGRKGSKKVQ